MDQITPSPPAWPLQPGGPRPRWNPDDILESTKRQHLAQLNQQLFIAKAELDVASFRSILSELENIRYGLDPRYYKAPPALVTSAVTSAFSDDGSPIADNNAPDKDRKKWFRFSKVSRLLRRLLFFRRRPRGGDGGD
jgi:hypothetical protein